MAQGRVEWTDQATGNPDLSLGPVEGRRMAGAGLEVGDDLVALGCRRLDAPILLLSSRRLLRDRLAGKHGLLALPYRHSETVAMGTVQQPISGDEARLLPGRWNDLVADESPGSVEIAKLNADDPRMHAHTYLSRR